MKLIVKMKPGFKDVAIDKFKLTTEDGEVSVDLKKKQIEALKASGVVDFIDSKKKESDNQI